MAIHKERGDMAIMREWRVMAILTELRYSYTEGME